MRNENLDRLGERAQVMLDALAAVSSEPGRLTRLYLTPEHKKAVDLVAGWMRRAGMQVRMDAAGGVHAVLSAGRDGSHARRRLLVGSHIDTVIDAGKFDGALGVVAALVAAEEIQSRRLALPFDLEIIAFGDEEGVRFPRTLIGSSAVAGALDPAVLEMTDEAGVTLRDALLRFGCDPSALFSETFRRQDVVGYLEVHIEQGPQLEWRNEPLGGVVAIAAQSRHRMRITGEPGHAGTVPMALRRDALAGAAEIIVMTEEVARSGASFNLVVTIGDISVEPGAVNVIPGTAQVSLDVRAPTDEARDRAVEAIHERSRQIADGRGLAVDFETVHEKSAVACSPRFRQAIAAAIGGLTGRRPVELVSGAGHDGLAMAHLTDIGMIFVRCRSGISHSPLEHVTVADLGCAVAALIETVVAIAREESG